MRKLSFFIAIILFVITAGGAAAATRNAEVTAANGMVASAHALASQAGVDILKKGGNAVDAAVAAAFAVGVVEPNASGIGGEGMMVIYLARDRRAVAIDYRSSAPAGATTLERIPPSGPASIAVPGTVAGLCLALVKHGTLPLAEVLAPSIRLAEEGFAVSSTLATMILDGFEDIIRDESLAAILCPDGLPLEAGDTLRNPDLAATLRLIASGGPDVFYRGELARKIIAGLGARGGVIAASDFAGYRAVEREPVRGRYRGQEIISAPPPVGGLAVVEALHILEQFKLKRLDPLGADRVHLTAEAVKLAMADWRAYVGDPDFVEVPTYALLSKKHIRSRASLIDPARAAEAVGPGDPFGRESPSTTSLAVVDNAGNMVALTQTISDFFGAKVCPAGTGVILNNELKNFSAEGPNALAPAKRMRTTIAPTLIVRRGRAFAALGTPGAARILATTPLLISNIIDYGMGIQAAIEAPRFFPGGATLEFEPRFPPATVSALERKGHALKPHEREFDLYFGGAQGIVVDSRTRKLVGGADPRRDGAVVGY